MTALQSTADSGAATGGTPARIVTKRDWAAHDAAIPYRDTRLARLNGTNRAGHRPHSLDEAAIGGRQVIVLPPAPPGTGGGQRHDAPRVFKKCSNDNMPTAAHTAPPVREAQGVVDTAHTALPARAARSGAVPVMVSLRPVPRAPAKRVADNDNTQPNAGRSPLLEEIKAGRFGARHIEGLRWFAHQEEVAATMGGGTRRSTGDGAHHPHVSRDPSALFGQEIAAEYALKEHKLARDLGPLRAIIDKAIHGAEMAALAPRAIPLPRHRKAAAGRLRLGAGLDICALHAAGDRPSRWEVQEIVRKAADEVWSMAATRRMPADNDNNRAENDNKRQSTEKKAA